MNLLFTTFNARYSHTALALRCLRANMGALREHTTLLEFEHTLNPQTAAERILAQNPSIVLFSVYIWNGTVTQETVAILKMLRPELKIIIGGPEVSYAAEQLPIFDLCDHLIQGEGEAGIEKICRDLLDGVSLPKIISLPAPNLATVELPYDEYTDADIANRRMYVETTRGCPFSCQYCLSALECGIRTYPYDKIFPAFEKLIARGARVFKLIDRSFNINPTHALTVIDFFIEHFVPGMMLHLEWEPEQLPKVLEDKLASLPDGFLQLEVGVQTFNQEVADRIERRLDADAVEQTIRTFSNMACMHLHADLIAGLPGEDLKSFAAGFDRLHACGVNEIQLGILKKLFGAPIAQHDEEFGMLYNPVAPYDILQTSTLSFNELQDLRRFARYWDITVNNGRFKRTAPLIWTNQPSVFAAFDEWAHWLYATTQSTAGFTPGRLSKLLTQFLTQHRGLKPHDIRPLIEQDLDNRKPPAIKGMERQSRG